MTGKTCTTYLDEASIRLKKFREASDASQANHLHDALTFLILHLEKLSPPESIDMTRYGPGVPERRPSPLPCPSCGESPVSVPHACGGGKALLRFVESWLWADREHAACRGTSSEPKARRKLREAESKMHFAADDYFRSKGVPTSTPEPASEEPARPEPTDPDRARCMYEDLAQRGAPNEMFEAWEKLGNCRRFELTRMFDFAFNAGLEHERLAHEATRSELLRCEREKELLIKQSRTASPMPTVEEWEALNHAAHFNLLAREAFRKLKALLLNQLPPEHRP